MIEEEHAVGRGNPEREAKAWLDKLAETDRRREGYLDLAADSLMDKDELRAKLAALAETRLVAERELRSIEGRKARLRDLERDKEALLEEYSGLMPETLEALTAEERHAVYGKLRLRVVYHKDGPFEVIGAIDRRVLGTVELAQTVLVQEHPVAHPRLPRSGRRRGCDDHTRARLGVVLLKRCGRY